MRTKSIIAVLASVCTAPVASAAQGDTARIGCEAVMRAQDKAAVAEVRRRYSHLPAVEQCAAERLEQFAAERRPPMSAGSAQPNIPAEDAASLVRHSYAIWPKGTLPPDAIVSRSLPDGQLTCTQLAQGKRICKLRPR